MRRLRFVADVNPPVRGLGRSDAGTEISFLPLDRIWSDKRFDPSETIEFTGDVQSYNPVTEGDLLVPKVSPTFAHGRTAIARGLTNGRALATSEVFVVRPHDPAAIRFLQYRLLARDFLDEGEGSWFGVAGLKRISADFLRDVRVYRSAWEQKGLVAEFLDRETERLSALSSSASLFVERAMTGHWESAAAQVIDSSRPSIRLKHLVEVPVGGAWGEEPGAAAVTVRCARVADFDRDCLTVARVATERSYDTRSAERLELRSGDLLLEKSGGGATSPVGFLVMAGDEAAGGVFSNFIARLRPTASDPRYLLHVFGVLYFTGRNAPFIKQVTGIQNLDVDAYLTTHVPRRSLEEQRHIRVLLDAALSRALAVRAKARGLTERLAEYRDALITEAVTGQLDVTRLSEQQMDEQAHAAMEGEPLEAVR